MFGRIRVRLQRPAPGTVLGFLTLLIATGGVAYAAPNDTRELKDRVAALETRLARVSYDATGLNGKPTLKIKGANLQIVDGSGETSGAVNGRGNLFIGYDEQDNDTQTGSHNLILGSTNSFTSYGGLVAGRSNNISARFASVTGGSGNTASGAYSVVSGGRGNTASSTLSSLTAGQGNTASAYGASILGAAGIKLDATMGFFRTSPCTPYLMTPGQAEPTCP